jgi:hypothetical protein
MGADIHMYLEKKLPTGEWATVQTFEHTYRQAFGLTKEGATTYSNMMFWQLGGRFYRLFAKLAGVRGEGPEPKGIPPDASPLYRWYAGEWSGDGHSHSWCSAQEFVTKYIEAIEEQDGESEIQKMYVTHVLERGTNVAVLQFVEVYGGVNVREEDKADDYRFCFFFDN